MLDDIAIRGTIWLSLLLYLPAVLCMVRLTKEDWEAGTSKGRLTRRLWTGGCAVYLLHVVAAFHFAHGWSHRTAMAHVRQASGVGEGIYVSYLFTLLWALDASWWWLRPERYARRPVWLGWLLHGFFLFVVVNATVVFESGLIRWLGVAFLIGLGAAWILPRPHR